MTLLILLFNILPLLCVVRTADSAYSASSVSDVLRITKHYFVKVTKKVSVFVKFYSPYCKHFQDMEEEVKTVVSAVKSKTVFADVETSVKVDFT